MLIDGNSTAVEAAYQALCGPLQTQVRRQRWAVTGAILAGYSGIGGATLAGWWVLPGIWAAWLPLVGVIGLPGLILLTVWEWGLWDRRGRVARQAQRLLPLESGPLYALGARAFAEASPLGATAQRALLGAVIARLFPPEVVVSRGPRGPVEEVVRVRVDLAALDGPDTASPVAVWLRSTAAHSWTPAE